MFKKLRGVSNKGGGVISLKEYTQTFAELKKHIQQAQLGAALAANKELIKLYWDIGKTITEKQKECGWGSRVIECLAKDLQNEFPGITGFSRANIFNMRAFYIAYRKVSQAARQFDELPFFKIPWWHNVILLSKIKNTQERLWYAQKTIEQGWSRNTLETWYAQKTIEQGWSRNTLETWIKSDLYHREGKAITNFSKTLPSLHSDIAKQSLKDPYLFDFLTLHHNYVEKELEQGLIDHIQKFLLELGQGFAFVARQKHFEVGGDDFYIDLLFYHVKLRCYIVIELKTTSFKPEYAGQLNFYLSVVDDLLCTTDDKPTIGLLLCKTKNNVVAEYALRDINKPIGVADYETKLVESLPKEFKSSLPTIQEIETELEKHTILSQESTKQAKRTMKKKASKYEKAI